jgi:hypothetical protein
MGVRTSLFYTSASSSFKENSGSRLDIVVHTCNPSYSGGGDRKIAVRGWPGQKAETLSENQTKSKRMGAWLKW